MLSMERKNKSKTHTLKWITGSVLVVYLLSMGLITSFQEKIIFLPTTLDNDYQYSFETPFEELFFDTDDGALLNALHFKADNPKGLILYFHGNAGNLERWGKIVQLFPKKGWDVLVMDYRTYGKSTGNLNEILLYTDAQLMYDHAATLFSENQILVYGRSLGSTFASYVSANNTPMHTVLEAPFYNLYDVARERFPIFPIKPLLRYQFNNNIHIAKVENPITVFHGTDDEVVAYDSGRRLFEAIKRGDKQFITIEGGRHNNLIEFETYSNAIADLLKKE